MDATYTDSPRMNPTTNTTTQTPALPSRRRLTIGRIVSALPALFLLFDGGIKLVEIAAVTESFARLGYPSALARGVGILELVCLALYLIPGTATLGAILLTGFLGGAISTHLRVGDPFVSHVLFPTYVGVLIWGGLLLRDDRLLALIPLRRGPRGVRRRARCSASAATGSCR